MQIQLTITQEDINRLGKKASKLVDEVVKDPNLLPMLYRYVMAPNPPKTPKPTKAKRKAKRTKP